jgi:hypothetical protein
VQYWQDMIVLSHLQRNTLPASTAAIVSSYNRVPHPIAHDEILHFFPYEPSFRRLSIDRHALSSCPHYLIDNPPILIINYPY